MSVSNSRRGFLRRAAAVTSLYGAGLVSATPARADAGGAGAAGVLSRHLARDEMEKTAIHKTPLPVPVVPFQTEAGETLTLADLMGETLLVNFWATWCAPCLRELPSIDRMAAAMAGRPFRVVAISVDRAGAAKSREFYERLGLTTLDLYTDKTMTIAREMKAGGLPVNVVIDRHGREVARLTGHAEWDAPEAIALLEAAMAL